MITKITFVTEAQAPAAVVFVEILRKVAIKWGRRGTRFCRRLWRNAGTASETK